MMTPEHDLAYYVDRLCRPYTVPYLQGDGVGPSRIGEARHDGMIEQVRLAVVGSFGAHEGASKAQGSERLPFNADAEALYATMRRLAEARLAEFAVATFDRPEDNLEAWEVHLQAARVSGNATEREYEAGVRLLAGWVQQVEQMFDPWSTREFHDPCPVCHERYAYDPGTGNRVRAFVMQYRLRADGGIEVGEVWCRFCGEYSASGTDALVELFELLWPDERVAQCDVCGSVLAIGPADDPDALLAAALERGAAAASVIAHGGPLLACSGCSIEDAVTLPLGLVEVSPA